LCAIEVIRREKKKNKKLQAELDKKEDTQELEQMITDLKVQIEKDKIIEEALKEQLNSKVLDDIISSQKPHHEKSRLG
jgi:nickel-dependent lactate racemase